MKTEITWKDIAAIVAWNVFIFGLTILGIYTIGG